MLQLTLIRLSSCPLTKLLSDRTIIHSEQLQYSIDRENLAREWHPYMWEEVWASAILDASWTRGDRLRQCFKQLTTSNTDTVSWFFWASCPLWFWLSLITFHPWKFVVLLVHLSWLTYTVFDDYCTVGCTVLKIPGCFCARLTIFSSSSLVHAGLPVCCSQWAVPQSLSPALCHGYWGARQRASLPSELTSCISMLPWQPLALTKENKVCLYLKGSLLLCLKLKCSSNWYWVCHWYFLVLDGVRIYVTQV